MTEGRLVRFYRELKRRKVMRVAVVYAVVAWLLVEVASVILPELLLPDWSVRLVIALAILGFPIAVILAWAVELTPDGPRADTGGVSPAGAAAALPPARPTAEDTPRSIAVLPLLNLSNDPDNEYFSDGMADELINRLSKLPQLTVASRTSSFSFKGRNVDLRTVAGSLGVDAILEGSVRRSGERVRITAQLVDGRSDRHLWSETYDRELKEVFSVQDEIARSIVQALEINLTPRQQRSLSHKPATEDMGAYDFYLRGRYFLERGDATHALQMFDGAIARDPDYALAWAGAATTCAWACMWGKRSAENLRGADEYSRKAIELAPELAEAHASRGIALAINEEYAEAEREYRLAIDLDPQFFDSYYYAGRVYFTQGRFEEAADMFAKAAIIRPDDVAAATLQVTVLQAMDKRPEAREAARRAKQVAERHLQLNPDDALALSRYGNTLVELGEREKGVEHAERAYAINPGVCGYNVACVFILVGDTDRALAILEEQARSSTLYRHWLENDSDWDAVRDHPRFRAVLESLG